MQEFGPASQFPELKTGQLINLVERWLRVEQTKQRALRAKAALEPKVAKTDELPVWSNGWAAGRLASTMKDDSNAVSMYGSSNTVMRM